MYQCVTREPCAPGTSADEDPSPLAPTAGAAGTDPARPLVLVVDDDPDTLDMAREFLSFAGARVVTARSAEDALVVARSILADVVVTDYAMPGRHGLDLVRDLRSFEPTRDVPAVIVSGHVGAVPMLPDSGERPIPVLAKPVNLRALAELVRKLARR